MHAAGAAARRPDTWAKNHLARPSPHSGEWSFEAEEGGKEGGKKKHLAE